MIRDEETTQALVDTVARFVRERLVPLEHQVAETDQIPPAVVQDMREMGLFGLTIPEAYGGLALTMEDTIFAPLAPDERAVFKDMLAPVKDYPARHTSTLLAFEAVTDAVAEAVAKGI